MSRRASSLVWRLSALGAIALHAGGAVFAFSHLPSENVDADDGAAVMEISMAFEAPRREHADLAPGPASDAAAASTASVEQTVQTEPTPMPTPTETPTETENPDRVVAQEQAKTPEEKPPDVAKAQTHHSSESAAAEATAEPTLAPAKEALKAAAPVQGSGVSAVRVRTTWQRRLVAHLDRNKRYPDAAQRRSVELVVSFTLDRTGRVVASRIVKSSGANAYDQAALGMLKRADPVPPPPPLVADEGLTFTLPVIFNARQ